MAWSGGTYRKGNYSTNGWTGDASLGIGIEAGRHDTQDDDFATGINACLNKDGSNSATGNINAGGFKVTNVAAGTAAAPAICAGNDINTGIFSPAADEIGIANNGVETVRINSTGQIGVGTTTPGGAFDIQSTGAAIIDTRFSNDVFAPSISLRKSRGATVGTNTIVQNNDSVGQIYFSGASGSSYQAAAMIGGYVDGTPGASNDMPGRLQFFTTPDGSATLTERMRITSLGQIGFGTAAPTAFYEFNRNSNDNASSLGIVNANAGSAAASVFYLGNNSSATGAGLIYNSSTNATNAGANGLTVYQGIAGGKIRVQAVSAGVELLAGATSWSAVSDSRLKKNIQPLSYGLAEIEALNPVRFDYNEDESNDSKRMGFIAQEVLPIIPEVVVGKEETFYGLSATEFIPTLVKAIQELNGKVEALEARIAALEA